MTDITKTDLIELKDDIKDHIDMKIQPIIEDIKGHDKVLFGKDGRNGVVGDVNNIKASGRTIKWIAGGGLFSGLSGWINKLLN